MINLFWTLKGEEKLLKVHFDINFEFILPCKIIKTRIQNSSMCLFI